MTEPFHLSPQTAPTRRGEARCRTCGEVLTVLELEAGYCGKRDLSRCNLECEGEKR